MRARGGVPLAPKGTLRVRSQSLGAALASSDPSVRLVSSLLRSCTGRGSDVRLDANELMAPQSWPRRPCNPERWVWRTVSAWPWRKSSHITALETAAVLACMEWRVRSATHLRTRFAHGIDNHGTIGVLTKGRSSSRILQAIVSRVNALCLASSCLPA